MAKRIKPGTFRGSLYARGGVLVDKYGNITRIPVTWRSNKHGGVFDDGGKLLGMEKNKSHFYARDEKKAPLALKRRFVSDAQRKAVMAKLKGR